MNGQNFNDAKSENRPDKSLEEQWQTIDWKKAGEYVNRLQLRIVKAVENGNWNLVKRLQYLITHSFYAKALAIRQVTRNKGRKTPGIDGVLWTNGKQKFQAIKELRTKGYKPLPTKRIYIKKSNGKLRPLSVPSMKDRAMQTLYMYALQPIEETLGDRRSFGFRKYRSCADAMEQLSTILSTRKSGKWILEGDIKGCFDSINHKWLLDNIPMDKTVLNKFLKAGYVYQKQLFPTTRGAIQGGTISPTLANLTLDGLEHEIERHYFLTKKGKFSRHSRCNPYLINIVRYADDFVVTSNSKEILFEIKEIIAKFLGDRGLELSEEKTIITNISDGFDFLGWNFRKYQEKLIIKPSKKSIDSITERISEIIKANKTVKQEHLIYKINPVLRGWCNYHQCVCAKETFGKLNYRIFWMLWKWAKRRHPNKGSNWIKEKYWCTRRDRTWIFTDGNAVLIRPTDISIVRHERLKLEMNPYTDQAYFLSKKEKRKKAKKETYKRTAAYRFNLTNMKDLQVKNA